MSEDYKPNPYEDAKNQLREAQKSWVFPKATTICSLRRAAK